MLILLTYCMSGIEIFLDDEEEECEETWICEEKDCIATIKVKSERIILESQNIKHSCSPCLRMTDIIEFK